MHVVYVDLSFVKHKLRLILWQLSSGINAKAYTILFILVEKLHILDFDI